MVIKRDGVLCKIVYGWSHYYPPKRISLCTLFWRIALRLGLLIGGFSWIVYSILCVICHGFKEFHGESLIMSLAQATITTLIGFLCMLIGLIIICGVFVFAQVLWKRKISQFEFVMLLKAYFKARADKVCPIVEIE